MGARQSKRSVDITTGKEVAVEGSEVAAGAGGEGKLERIEDLDTLKPQLNGDAHQDEPISEKEKKMQEQDERQENEKDNCNEKEIVLTPVTVNGSGEGEVKEEEKNVEQEQVKEKKPKKEKVKKKWSFRSISFSKKDKQKPAKKEETNGECEKVPEEGADAAPVVAEVADAKVESAPEKDVSEKEPETPVTEPLTNGSSAPETPKEEVKQNGESASVEEQPSPVEPVAEEKQAEVAKSEPVVESPKQEEKVEEKAPEVEALEINGLTIEEPAPVEVKAPVEDVPLPVEVKAEQKIEVVGDSEVCEKELPDVGSVEVAPPPLPSCPPPSSLTIFAESTMAPLVDTQNVDASLIPADNISQSEPVVQNVSNESETASSQDKTTALSNALISVEKPNGLAASPVGNETIDVTKDESPVAENVAVVSADNLVVPDSSVIEASASVEPAIENTKVDTSSSSSEPSKIVETEVPFVEPSVVLNSSDVVSEIPKSTEIPSEVIDSVKTLESVSIDNSVSSRSEEPVPSVENVNVINSEPNLPSPIDETNNGSPILQRGSSDLDVSETMPPSDSFPPPPPPESCPDSITETSASESLPPPISEFSVPDAILNSPTSETADLPGKDEVVSNGDSVPESNQIQENGVHHDEVNGLTMEESPSSEVENVPGHPEKPSVEIPQVKTVSDVTDVPVATEAVTTESAPSGDTVNE